MSRTGCMFYVYIDLMGLKSSFKIKQFVNLFHDILYTYLYLDKNTYILTNFIFKTKEQYRI